MKTRCTTIDARGLDDLVAAARAHPRLRKNLNLHASDDSKSHRLINAVEPGSYIRPHRHLDQEKDETFGWVRGSFGVILFDDTGAIVETHLLAPGHALLVTVPSGQWHTAVSLDPGSVFFESKAGPYRPLQESEKAPWAPDEGAPAAEAYLTSLKARVRGAP
jgi:cupin fold WbuC family metalloprotein